MKYIGMHKSSIKKEFQGESNIKVNYFAVIVPVDVINIFLNFYDKYFLI